MLLAQLKHNSPNLHSVHFSDLVKIELLNESFKIYITTGKVSL